MTVAELKKKKVVIYAQPLEGAPAIYEYTYPEGNQINVVVGYVKSVVEGKGYNMALNKKQLLGLGVDVTNDDITIENY